MNFLKRVSFLLITNILVTITLSIILNILGVQYYLTQQGIDYQALAIFCLAWGMTSSFINLLLSRWMAKIWTGVKLIDPSTSVQQERQLIQKVYHLARRIGLHTMPEVGIYDSAEVNAFATGPTKNKALIAVSSGLLDKMSEDEIEGVLAHEISHINNGDMVTMLLLVGVVNAFTLFVSRVIAYNLSKMLNRNDRDHRFSSRALYILIRILCDFTLTILANVVIAAFSRYREYRADKNGAGLVGRQKMIAGLERLRSLMMLAEDAGDSAFEVLKISREHKRNRFLSLLATHPDINLRIAALKH